ncbi:hypothetical protein BpHYR1_041582 [Brachionus plicatilis]|uniref:Uncharacterized protein n=1 Tax=Brachionus plicatilis TaxID=10195 RepID=A0A3M7SRK2_BRAPC|nr:hypothetical protein BpHYR1_041582 [Brachionus plicatilis]
MWYVLFTIYKKFNEYAIFFLLNNNENQIESIVKALKLVKCISTIAHFQCIFKIVQALNCPLLQFFETSD